MSFLARVSMQSKEFWIIRGSRLRHEVTIASQSSLRLLAWLLIMWRIQVAHCSVDLEDHERGGQEQSPRLLISRPRN